MRVRVRVGSPKLERRIVLVVSKGELKHSLNLVLARFFPKFEC